ncbi:MAG TPA: TolC family protein [Bryobacteraceae bacterium]
MLLATHCGAQELLTLQDAISTAINGNRQVQISALDISKASAATAEARTARFPQFSTYILGGSTLNPINFTIPRGALGVYPTVGPIPGADANINTSPTFAGIIYGSAAQPLSQLYKIRLGVRESQLGEELAKENLRETRQQAAQQVRQAYYQIVQTQSQITSAEATLKYLTELSALTERNLAEETVLKSDSLNVKAKLSQQKYQLLTLRDGLATQKEALNRLLGRDLETDFSVEVQSLPSIAELDLKAANQKALDQRSEIRKARLQNRKTELDIRRERAEYLPNVSLQLSYLSLAHVNLLPANIAHAGFLLEWQPFDWGQKRHRIEQLQATAKEAALTTKDVEQQVLLDVHAKYRKLLEARALLETLTTVQEAEREKLRVVMNRYEQKAALLAEVMQQQSSVAQADGQYQQAIASFWNARADFDRALGEEY